MSYTPDQLLKITTKYAKIASFMDDEYDRWLMAVKNRLERRGLSIMDFDDDQLRAAFDRWIDAEADREHRSHHGEKTHDPWGKEVTTEINPGNSSYELLRPERFGVPAPKKSEAAKKKLDPKAKIKTKSTKIETDSKKKKKKSSEYYDHLLSKLGQKVFSKADLPQAVQTTLSEIATKLSDLSQTDDFKKNKPDKEAANPGWNAASKQNAKRVSDVIGGLINGGKTGSREDILDAMNRAYQIFNAAGWTREVGMLQNIHPQVKNLGQATPAAPANKPAPAKPGGGQGGGQQGGVQWGARQSGTPGADQSGSYKSTQQLDADFISKFQEFIKVQNNLGLGPNPLGPRGVDGKMGDFTRKALQAWQRQNGVMPASGEFDEETMKKLTPAMQNSGTLAKTKGPTQFDFNQTNAALQDMEDTIQEFRDGNGPLGPITPNNMAQVKQKLDEMQMSINIHKSQIDEALQNEQTDPAEKRRAAGMSRKVFALMEQFGKWNAWIESVKNTKAPVVQTPAAQTAPATTPAATAALKREREFIRKLSRKYQ